MAKVRVSVLVPIYNAVDYLQNCLDSLAGQSMKEMEFILVNDGSSDRSLEIMQKKQKEDARFVIIDKKNTGYGDSLNKALRMAKGEYIGIVEPDDFCDHRMFGELYKLAKQKSAEIVRGNYYDYCDGGKKMVGKKFLPKGKEVFHPAADFEVFYENPAIWSAIYERGMIEKNGINFLPTEGASYQDAGFNFKTLACAKKVVYTSEPLYYYRIDNPKSSVKNEKKVMAVVKEFDEIEHFIEKLDNYKLLIKYCQVAKFGAYHWNMLRLREKEAKKFIKIAKEDFKKQREENNLVRRFFPRKYWISLQLMLALSTNTYWHLLNLRKLLKDNIIKG